MVQGKNNICVPSQITEKHVEPKIVLKFLELPKALFTAHFFFQEKLGHLFVLSSNTTDTRHFIACIHIILTPIFIKTIKLLLYSFFHCIGEKLKFILLHGGSA